MTNRQIISGEDFVIQLYCVIDDPPLACGKAQSIVQ